MPSSRSHPPIRLQHVSFPLHLTVVILLSFLRVRQTMTSTMTSQGTSHCSPGEWQCGSGQAVDKDDHQVQCIGHNKFCDGIQNCDDGSDEPIGCTNCNRTFVGEANIKYPVRVTGPFQRYLPFVCQISFVAAGKEYGDFVEITFLSFQIGSLEFTRNQTPICQKGYLKISEDTRQQSEIDRRNPYSVAAFRGSAYPMDPKGETSANPEFGQFCGALMGRSVTYFSEGSNVSVTAVVPSRASIPSSSFGLYLTYRFLSRKFEFPHKSRREPLPYLGSLVPGTYCDRLFNDCSSSHRRCTIRSPNFPGFYPRNITCQYSIRQQHVPEGHITRIILSQPNDYKISVPTGRTSSTTGTTFLLSTDCIGGDVVRIYDGPSIRSPVLLEFCGSGALPEVVSSKGEVLVHIYSAPYQLLRSSRVEIDVQVRFEIAENGQSASHGSSGSSGRCSQTFLGSRKRWGVVKSPKHSMPRNANCSFKFIGASNFDRVWIYFISFFALMEKRPTPSGEEQESCSSKVELFDSSSSSNSSLPSSSRGVNEEPTASFCGDISPRICAHAADYPPLYLPPRPCDTETESYVSVGSEFTIRHRFLAPASEVVTTTTSSFVARYEFVDTRQSGTPIDHSECDRRFDSRLSKSGTFSNPRNVFLYGRGGKSNISCMYHFVGLPSERVRITLRKVLLFVDNSSCKMSYDSVMQKHACKWLRPTDSKSQFVPKQDDGSYASISAVEYWDGHSSALGCLCNATVDTRQPPVIFESLVSNVKLTFLVNHMNTLKDFENYGFYANFEFVNSTICERGLRRQTGATGEGVLSFQVPSPVKMPSEETRYQLQPVRCRWLIEASAHKYLYLKFKGLNTSTADKCEFGNRILVYLDPRSKPVANACVDEKRRTSKDTFEEFDIFSHTWYNETHGRGDNRDKLFVEVIANPRESRSNFDLHWLEVTKPFVRTQSGQTLRNVDCLFECPEIGACIDPELWCDGTLHCPSGYDESLEHCRTFPTAYVSSSIVGIVLIMLLIAWIVVRRRRARRRLKKKDIRRLPQDDCLNMESPVG